MLAGAIRAFQITGRPLKDQRILFFGAGSSGVGVAETIAKYFEAKGIPEEQAKKMFWLVDSKVRPLTPPLLNHSADVALAHRDSSRTTEETSFQNTNDISLETNLTPLDSALSSRSSNTSNLPLSSVSRLSAEPSLPKSSS